MNFKTLILKDFLIIFFSHQCVNKTLTSCGYVVDMIPVTETVEECISKDVQKCMQHWACKDDAASDNPLKKITINGESDPCEDDEFRDDPDQCVMLPQSICSEKEVTIEFESRKKVCEDTPYPVRTFHYLLEY